MRLDEFLTSHRQEVIARCRAKVRARRAPRATEDELDEGVPSFLEHLIESLRLQLTSSAAADEDATAHGGVLMRKGFTVAQVVHDYGDVCQTVTELAIEKAAPISTEDFRVLNRCLDDATAFAVTEFGRLHDAQAAEEGNQRLGIFAHEARNLINTATLSFDVLKQGSVGIGGSTGAVLERSLAGLTVLVASSLAEVRLEAGNVRRERLPVCRLLEEIEIAGSLNAKAKGVALDVELPHDTELTVVGDPQILAAIVFNLVQNGIKFTPKAGRVRLSSRVTERWVCVDVEDQCGGLPPRAASALMQPFLQDGSDRSGLGLGLFIARRGALAHGGAIAVKDLPGQGCIFTLELPHAP